MASVTIRTFLATLPTLVCCSQLYGAATRNSTQEQGDPTLTLATWNVLSVSKCETSANGFIGMEAAAFNAHNELAQSPCETGTQELAADAPEDATGVEVPLCPSAWIQRMIPEIMEGHNVDVMFLQEIDYLMLLGLRLLPAASYKSMPITGEDGRKNIEEGLKNKKVNEKGKPASDTAYVVWRTAADAVTVTCKKAGEDIPEVLDKGKTVEKKVDMSKVGHCSVKKGEAKGAIGVEVIGMHGDGDVGFTAAQSQVILKKAEKGGSKIVVDAVLGDINRGTAREVLDAVSPLNDDLLVPHKGERTVYRVVHRYRKLVQAVQNSEISALTEKATCASIPANEKAKDKDGKETGELVTNTGMKKWCADVAAVKASHGKSEKDLAALDETTKKTLKVGKLVNLIKHIAGSNKELWDTIQDETFPWQSLPKHLGLDDQFGVVNIDEARRSMQAEVQREDWVAYDHIKFDLVRATVLYDEKLREVSHPEGSSKPTVEVKYPIAAMASDHLPVIMELKVAKSSSGHKHLKRCLRKFLRAFGLGRVGLTKS